MEINKEIIYKKKLDFIKEILDAPTDNLLLREKFIKKYLEQSDEESMKTIEEWSYERKRHSKECMGCSEC